MIDQISTTVRRCTIISEQLFCIDHKTLMFVQIEITGSWP